MSHLARRAVGLCFVALILRAGCPVAAAAEKPDFDEQIEPLLTTYCYECHAFGANKGQVAFDKLKTEDERLQKKDLWAKVLRNVRSGIMPPKGSERPTADEVRLLEQWIKHTALAIDPADPDPGRVTLRRLNRTEYRNTIRDLMGYDFRASEEFPADDTGFGFDNIGDVLSISSILLEKYLKAAESIVAAAVPTVARTAPERTLTGADFRTADDKPATAKFSFYAAGQADGTFEAKHPGTYKIAIELVVRGQFKFDPGRVRAVVTIDDREVVSDTYGWNATKKYRYDVETNWKAGKHQFRLALEPLVPAEQRINGLDLEIGSVRIEGPQEDQFRLPTKGYDRFFTRPAPPEDDGEKREYAREVLARFAGKAFRRPADPARIEPLVAIAEAEYRQKGKRFEDGIRRAMVPILASPRFLFRIEAATPDQAAEKHPLIDEYALASRLSYFLWSTMPDEELFRLAEQGKLRANLPQQIKRMVAHSRSQALIENFVGQWLQVRDVETIAVNERAVLAREDEELRKLIDQVDNAKSGQERRAAARALEARQGKEELNPELRKAMQQEVEKLFATLLQDDGSIDDLIDADYTFLNEKLAAYYGVPDVRGSNMRKVDLPDDSPRGGVLTMGAILMVTSNPDRTSPVKRGLFVLDNLLGAAPPPPPPDIPALEASESQFKDKTPTLRELLELHRSNALCNSCHSRMDPLGLAFENFNALGKWRDKEHGQEIEAAGELITGEGFQNVRELKRILVTQRQADFYRCLTEKLLIYALGRGLTNEDVDTVDRIVDRLAQENGKMSALIFGIIQSPQFQKHRNETRIDDKT